MKYFTYKLDLMVLNVLACVIVVLMTILTYVITGGLDFITNINLFSFVAIFLWLFLHEILHGIGFLSLGKVKRKNVVFGAELEKGIFYCMCKEKISKVNILIALMLPLVLIGIIPYIIGICISNDLLVLLAIFNISGSVGDILMMMDILLMPKDIMYLDLDDTTSFTILSKDNLSKNKYFSIILEKSGKYNDSIKAKEYKKIKVSKGSKYFLIFFLILFIISIIDMLGA